MINFGGKCSFLWGEVLQGLGFLTPCVFEYVGGALQFLVPDWGPPDTLRLCKVSKMAFPFSSWQPSQLLVFVLLKNCYCNIGQAATGVRNPILFSPVLNVRSIGKLPVFVLAILWAWGCGKLIMLHLTNP